MIKSMTGFGQSSGGRNAHKWVVEARSWNHRFFDCSVRVPGFLSGFEDLIRDAVHKRVKRGKVAVSITLKSKNRGLNELVVDEERIKFYVRSLKKIQKKYRLKEEPLNVNTLLNIPNVFVVDQKGQSLESYWSSLKGPLGLAIDQLLKARDREGHALLRELTKRLKRISTAVNDVEAVQESLPKERYARLKERTDELSQKISVDSSRLEQEIILFVDRSDITEEVVRTRHHLDQFGKSLKQKGEMGKKLDFIAQEIHREVNTMASKAQSSKISSHVIQMKTELDKIREQVLNVE
jgi:uncharacterized protein (TIGR00255 family)